MKNFILGITVLASTLSFGSVQDVASLDILCQSDLDAVCMDVKGKDSYALSHSCVVETFKKDGSVGDYLMRSLADVYNLLDPMCNDQQGCEQPDQSTGKLSKKYKAFWLDDSEKGYYFEETIETSMKFTDVQVEVLETVECE
tara:strand:- start:320 stop:745 length:426 start_codon:yes stop_codon:yes gene_type:complete